MKGKYEKKISGLMTRNMPEGIVLVVTSELVEKFYYVVFAVVISDVTCLDLLLNGTLLCCIFSSPFLFVNL